METVLQKEASLFDQHLEEWRAIHMGEFVLIKDDSIVGFFPTLSEAFKEGTSRYGLESFFVKQILPKDSINISLLGKHLRSAS